MDGSHVNRWLNNTSHQGNVNPDRHKFHFPCTGRATVYKQHLLTSVDSAGGKLGGSCIATKNDATAFDEHSVVFQNSKQLFHV